MHDTLGQKVDQSHSVLHWPQGKSHDHLQETSFAAIEQNQFGPRQEQ